MVAHDRVEDQYQAEIVRTVRVTRIRVHIGHCVACGTRVQGRHPRQTSDARGAAAGAFSATWITRIGGLVFALILAGAFLVQSCFSTVPTDPESLLEPEGIAGDRATVQLGARVQDLEQRAALDAAAAERGIVRLWISC